MAKLRGHEVVRVNQSASSPPTCFALPGNQGLAASWCNCSFEVHVAVYDDLSVYVGLNGNVNETVNPNNYPCVMSLSPDTWTWTWSGDHVVGPSSSWTHTVPVGPDRVFRWGFSCGNPAADNASGAGAGYVYAGTLDRFHGSDTSQDGYLYVGGTGDYPVTDPIYPVPVRITVPGFMRYLDYFPFAVFHDPSWASANRSGGLTQQYVNNSWVDRKNVAVGSGDNPAHYWNGNSWAVCPEIGEK